MLLWGLQTKFCVVEKKQITVDTDKWLAVQLQRVICPSSLLKLFGEFEAKPNDACLLAKWIIQYWTAIETGLNGYLEREKEKKNKKKKKGSEKLRMALSKSIL